MTFDQARRRRAVARWHRRFAVFIALWLIVLAVTGVLINHANDLGLDRKPLPGSVQRVVYGTAYHHQNLCGAHVAGVDDCTEVFARLQLPGGSLLLESGDVMLLDTDGQLVEKLTASHLGLQDLQGGLLHESQVYLRDSNSTVRVDTGLMEGEILDPAAALALNDRDWQVDGGRPESITWERLLLDLHAARFLGSLAKAFNDLMAGLIAVLALSGLWLFKLKNRNNGNGSSRRDS